MPDILDPNQNPLPDLLRPGADSPAEPPKEETHSIADLPQLAPVPLEPPPPAAEEEKPKEANLIVPALPADPSAEASAKAEDVSKSGPGKKEPPPPPPKEKKPGNRRNMVVGLVLLFLLLSTGVIFIFVNQQQQIADLRGRAEPLYPKECIIGSRDCTGGKVCHCQDGNACNQTKCELPSVTKDKCKEQGRSWCVNQGGEAYTCCAGGYVCGSSDGCYPGGNTPRPTRGPNDTPTPTTASINTPTNTPTGTPANTPTGTPANTPTGTPANTPTGTPVNTPTGTPSVTATPTNTATPTPTGISGIACNSTCAANSECSGSNVCVDGSCRNPSCPEKTSCSCDIAQAPSSCNTSCTVNADCSGGLVCLDNSCRSASYPESTTCTSPVAAPTPQVPVAGTGPSVLGASVIAGGFLLLLLGLLF